MIRKNKLPALIIAIAFLFFMITIIPSGLHYCFKDKCGLFFWGSNEHDGIWHIALAEAAFKKFPFTLPIFSGIKLTGYNYLMDLIIYTLSRLGIPSSFSYFQLLPFIWFIVFTFLLIKLAKKINSSSAFIAWFLFFSYFASSLAYVFTLYHQKTIWGSSSLLSQQSGGTLTNMQFALSLIFILLILLIIQKAKKISYRESVLLGLLVAISLGLKLYSGLAGTILIFSHQLLNVIRERKELSLSFTFHLFLKLGIIAGFFIAAIFIFYNPLQSVKTGSIFIFSPFATMHSMIEEPVLFYLKDMTNARYYLYEHGGLLKPRLMFIELFSTALFLFFSMGLRIGGFIYVAVKALRKKLSIFEGSVFTAAMSAFIFLALFIQKGDWWNVIQFYYYTLFMMNIFTAMFFYDLFRHLKSKMIVVVGVLIVVVITLPANVDILRTFTAFPSSGYISDQELQALNYLNKLPNGIVLAPYFKKSATDAYDPQSISAKKNSAFIPAFSGKQTFYEDEIVLNIVGVPFQKRREQLQNHDCSILKKVDYIYELKKYQDDFFSICKVGNDSLKKLFENSQAAIYLVEKK